MSPGAAGSGGNQPPISVSCAPMGESWTCRVAVGDDGAATTHEVTISAGSAALMGAAGPERLVEQSFRFLLEREPRESILRRFDLADIGRFFPEYRTEILRRSMR